MNRPVLAVAVLIFNGILLLNSADAQSSLPTTDASAAVTSGQWLQRVPPVYPPLARKAGIEGDVVLDVVIGADGTVNSAAAVRGDPFLTQSAVDAVRQWRYKPSEAGVSTQVTINFSLNDSRVPDTANVTVAGKGAEASIASTSSLKALPAAPMAAQNTSQRPAGNTAEFIKKAESGDAQAQFELGRMYDNGQGVTKDEAEAVRWYRKAAEQGHEWAQYDLGVAYDNGEGVAKDATEALRWYRKAAEQGDSDAQYSLGVAYHEAQGVTKDDAEAVRWFRKAAERGSAEAQLTLGQMYDSGQGIRKNKAEAALWYRKAAEQGNVSAQANLGLMYSNGQGVSLNRREADHWYQKAAEGREAIRQTEEGASQTWADPTTGLMWTEESKGDVNWYQAKDYCSNLNLGGYSDWRLATIDELTGIGIYDPTGDSAGRCNVRGNIEFHGIIEDSGFRYKNCRSWGTDGRFFQFDNDLPNGSYRLDYDKVNALCVRGFATVTLKRLMSMADQGDAQAQYSVGMAYHNGEGVPKNDAEAVSYFRKAAEKGEQRAGNMLCRAYLFGQGITKDEAEAFRWCGQSAGHGYADAQFNLGLMYETGQGVPKNDAEAAHWYRTSANGGNADANAWMSAKAEEAAAEQRQQELLRNAERNTERQAREREAPQREMAEQRAIAKMSTRWPKSQCIRAVNNFLKLNYPPSFFVDWSAVRASTLALVSERLTACESYSWTYEERNQLAVPLPFRQVVGEEQKWLNQTLNVRIAYFIKQQGMMEKFAWEGGGRNNTILLSDTLEFINRHGLMAKFRKYDDLQVEEHRRDPDVSTHGIGLLFGLAEQDVP